MNTPSATSIMRQLPVNNRATVLVEDQDLNDIIKAIKHYHVQHKPEYDQISQQFWDGNGRDTAKALFTFLKKHVPYNPESDTNQTIKRPGRLIQDAYSGNVRDNDCKHFSSFIVGVVDSLSRKGYPVSAFYRFVSDEPGRDVHHVFAVVRDRGVEYWVDPVLGTFDQRPNFYNTKDVYFNRPGIGRLTYLSGTALGNTDMGDTDMGKSKFKDFIKKAGKGVVKVAKKVKHVALKVGAATARNAFLLLLDVNAFNLAKRVSETLAHPQAGPRLRAKWESMGGNANKLASAAANGMRFKNRHKKGKIKGVSGVGDCVGMGVTLHSRHLTTHPGEWLHRYAMHNRSMRRHIMSGVSVGEPMTIATAVTLAATVIAILKPFLVKGTPAEEAALAKAGTQGGAEIIDQAAEAPAITEPGQPASKATADASMSIKTGTDGQGQPQVTVEDVRHPAMTNAGEPGGGAAADINPEGESAAGKQVAPAGESFGDQLQAGIKKHWKTGLAVAAVAVAVVKGPAIINSFSKRRR